MANPAVGHFYVRTFIALFAVKLLPMSLIKPTRFEKLTPRQRIAIMTGVLIALMGVVSLAAGVVCRFITAAIAVIYAD